MITILARKELLAHIKTLRWSIIFLCLVLVSALTGVVGSLDYSEAVDVYEQRLTDHREWQEGVTTYERANYTRFLPPQPVSIFARGSTAASGYGYWVRLSYKSPVPYPLSKDWDDRLYTLSRIDFTAAIALIGGLLALALGFDGICGERERGTLSLLLANSVSRAHVIVAKLAGGWLVLWGSLAVAFVLNVVIVAVNPDISFGADDWIRIGLIFVGSCLYLSAIFALALLVSTATATAASSLIICLFAWLILSVGYANYLPSFSRYLVAERSIQEYRTAYAELRQRLDGDMDAWDEANPSPGRVYTAGHEANGVLRYARPEGYDWMVRRNAYYQDKFQEMTDEATDLIWAITTGPHLNQGLHSERWTMFSPYTGYLTLARVLARSSVEDRLHIGRVGLQYHEQMLAHLRENAFGNRRWFTDDPPDQEPLVTDPANTTEEMVVAGSAFMRQRAAWIEQQEAAAEKDPRRKLDRRNDPVFPRWQRSLLESLSLGLSCLLTLVITCSAAVVVAVRRFQRYPAR